MSLTQGLIVFVGLLLAVGLWLMRQMRARQSQPTLRHTRTTATDSELPYQDTTPLGDSVASPAHPDAPPSDYGPATIVSYMDVPTNTRPQSDFSASNLSSLFPEDVEPDTGPSTLPQPTRDGNDLIRIRQALRDLHIGAPDRAWDALRGFVPELMHRDIALEAMDRVAQAFEKASRYDQARDVYEHMVDIEPERHHLKPRLMRARGLSQAATAQRWGTVPTPLSPQAEHKKLGKYIVEKEIGRGAMGAVYLGYDPVTDRKVALKTMSLSHEFSGRDLDDARARFLREAEMSGRLQHPDLVSIIDAGEDDGLAYIAMELIDGIDLSQYTLPGRLLPVRDVVLTIARVAEALAYAHERGVTHRDIKPANIMVNPEHDRVKVMDFGVARVADAARTRTGVVLGTPTFMSPEQLSGQPIDGRSDLYSLGVALFQLLTGQLPYRNDSMATLMRAIARDKVPNVCELRPDLPSALGDVVALALEKHPHTRYANGRQMADDLRAVAQGLTPQFSPGRDRPEPQNTATISA
ncbi:MAG: protein kinase [Aquabacterium sp.]|jgi:serine/threonine protein kinase|uniref:serine/threonine-protein kinase n=1 Tax=Aquabacterium sp. TaxID=1872578 RepID=UPI001B4395CB|nr:serine/threonine-protein kinase [Aquabacterium sp.]MBP7133137.1 protein kinase [Aquabacterium sp.]MBP9063032.1 protein kinase [Aquabacterium sp.]MDQ5925672.1 eukaryotic-like serine/threonine-protein kinase [Pseudomonadota bacterium]